MHIIEFVFLSKTVKFAVLGEIGPDPRAWTDETKNRIRPCFKDIVLSLAPWLSPIADSLAFEIGNAPPLGPEGIPLDTDGLHPNGVDLTDFNP